MTEYKLADGAVLTTEDIERESAEYESGTWKGLPSSELRLGFPQSGRVRSL